MQELLAYRPAFVTMAFLRQSTYFFCFSTLSFPIIVRRSHEDAPFAPTALGKRTGAYEAETGSSYTFVAFLLPVALRYGLRYLSSGPTA